MSSENEVKGEVMLITTFLLGHSRSGAPFQDVFSISVALSLSAVLRLSNITPGGSEAKVVGTQGGNEIFKIFKTILSVVLSHISIFFNE